MIHLRPMQPEEFQGFADYFIPDYAAEISTNYDVAMDVARARAEQALADDLSQGVDTPGQTLLCIVKDGDEGDAPVGYLWCKPDVAGPSVFISDFYIRPPHRGKGYAKAALIALESLFAESGHSEVKLRVAADNKPAQTLYLSAGFRVTGWNMQKAIHLPADT